jgi:hypothetical protein
MGGLCCDWNDRLVQQERATKKETKKNQKIRTPNNDVAYDKEYAKTRGSSAGLG